MSYFGTVKINPDGSYGAPSTANTTTTPLSGSATFTGTAEENDYPDVMCSCFSDTAGTLYFDFSVDGTNWRTFPTSGFSVSASIHEFHIAVKGPRHFRARFVNGSSAQSTFQLYTYYGSFAKPNSPLNQSLGLDSDATIIRPSLPELDISRSLWSGMTSTHKFGRNSSVGTSFVPITDGGVYQTPQAGSATTLRVKSGGNANDDAAGSGARQITLEGLDENFDLASETVATAGASASSATTTTFTRLFRAYVSESGTYATASAGSHSADITIENGAGGTDWATISATDFPRSQTEIASYSVPRNHTAYIKYVVIAVDSQKVGSILGFQRTSIDQTSAPYDAMRIFLELGGVSGEDEIQPSTPMGPFAGPCDIGFMGKVSTGSGEIDVDFEILLIEE